MISFSCGRWVSLIHNLTCFANDIVVNPVVSGTCQTLVCWWQEKQLSQGHKATWVIVLLLKYGYIHYIEDGLRSVNMIDIHVLCFLLPYIWHDFKTNIYLSFTRQYIFQISAIKVLGRSFPTFFPRFHYYLKVNISKCKTVRHIKDRWNNNNKNITNNKKCFFLRISHAYIFFISDNDHLQDFFLIFDRAESI